MKTTVPKKAATSAQRWAEYRKGKVQIAAYLLPETHARFKAKSTEKGRTMQSQLSQLIKKFIDGNIDV